ncbi:hypothetical protein QVD99_003806 [Batrachochytrium dendrobatidis]|nr:hypothetical protein O5D80_004115 [Batrachochytrium dendrobatidis]KAK5669411.1 hypothetical protein QVD99_003806 [Batrachochytrium dendrobatidis]
MHSLSRSSSPCACVGASTTSTFKCLQCKRRERHNAMMHRLARSIYLDTHNQDTSCSNLVSAERNAEGNVSDNSNGGNNIMGSFSDIDNGCNYGMIFEPESYYRIQNSDHDMHSKSHYSVPSPTMTTVNSVNGLLRRNRMTSDPLFWQNLDSKCVIRDNDRDLQDTNMSHLLFQKSIRHSIHCDCKGSGYGCECGFRCSCGF